MTVNICAKNAQKGMSWGKTSENGEKVERLWKDRELGENRGTTSEELRTGGQPVRNCEPLGKGGVLGENQRTGGKPARNQQGPNKKKATARWAMKDAHAKTGAEMQRRTGEGVGVEV